ncbi:MAG TPA: Fe-only nitrogenase accessory AnfO family protein [Syntrophomonas sp.]|nr:Fe-only nitrogenase accessory AnfO family protein [Syntrophomonas sp.]
MKIAVLMNESGRAASFFETAALLVYEKNGDSWVADQKYDWTPGMHHSMSALRTYLGHIVDWLQDCKVVAAKRSHGFYRVVFESCGVAVWAVEGCPQDFIPQIECFYNENTETGSEPAELICPIAGKTGFYAVDLREVMAHHDAYNSRDVLMPFFQKSAFERLEIICDHVPKWFQTELPALGLRADVEAQGSVMKVHVYPT